MFHRLLILTSLFIASCTAPVIELSPLPPAPTTPPPLVATDIQLEMVVVEPNPLRIHFSQPLFNPGAALPRAPMLDQLSSWLDFLQQKSASLWQVAVSVAPAETHNQDALAAARVNILRRLIQRKGLQLDRFEFITSSTGNSSVTFQLK